MGGLRWHAVCVGRLLRSTEGVGAEPHRVAKLAQGGRSEESRGVAESQHIAQASRLGGGGEVCMYKYGPQRAVGLPAQTAVCSNQMAVTICAGLSIRTKSVSAG